MLKMANLGYIALHRKIRQILRSIRSLAKKWSWSRSKVERFLKLLENRDMIETAGEHCVTRITISNYARYDPRKSKENFQTRHEPRHLRDRGETRPSHDRATNNNVKNVNNEKNGNRPAASFSSAKSFYQRDCDSAERSFNEAAAGFLENG